MNRYTSVNWSTSTTSTIVLYTKYFIIAQFSHTGAKIHCYILHNGYLYVLAAPIIFLPLDTNRDNEDMTCKYLILVCKTFVYWEHTSD